MPKIKFPDQGFQKLSRTRQADTLTDAPERIAMPHSQLVINCDNFNIDIDVHIVHHTEGDVSDDEGTW